MTTGSGFSDRAVGGKMPPPTSVDVDVRFEGDEVVAMVVLRRVLRAHPAAPMAASSPPR